VDRPESRVEPLGYAPRIVRSKWRAPLAFALALPVGAAAGKASYAAGFGSLVALIFFSWLCPFVICLVADRLWILVGVFVNACMCITVVALNLYDSGWSFVRDGIGAYASIIIISCLFSMAPSLLVAKGIYKAG